MADLIPRSPKRKRQPTAACMREQLALAADEIIALRTAQEGATFATWKWFEEALPRPVLMEKLPWWRRIFRKS